MIHKQEVHQVSFTSPDSWCGLWDHRYVEGRGLLAGSDACLTSGPITDNSSCLALDVACLQMSVVRLPHSNCKQQKQSRPTLKKQEHVQHRNECSLDKENSKAVMLI